MACGRVDVVEGTISTQNHENDVTSEDSRDTLDLTIISEALETCKERAKPKILKM